MSKNFKHCVYPLLLAICLASLAIPASADEVYQFIVKKQEEKKRNRWSLSEWLETRDRMRLMDLWLNLHSPSPYEFYIGGAYQSGKLDQTRDYIGGIGYLAAYATIFGLEIQREQSSAPFTTGIFHLRLLGFHAQATNLTLQGGLRQRGIGTGALRNPFAGASLTLYLVKVFGIEGNYRHFYKSNTDEFGTSLKGSRFEGGAFIDFRFVRVYGNYFSETETASLDWRQNAFPKRTGVAGGLKIFF